jgi:mRNA interferase RelE/StbE
VPYAVAVAESAQRRLDRIPNPTRSYIERRIAALSEQPRPPGAIPLKNDPHRRWRLRVGDWRVLYVIDDRERTVLVTNVLPRGEAYRDF